MFTLAHLSDPHLGPLPSPSFTQLISKRILGYLNWKLNRTNSLSDYYLNSLLKDLHEQKPDHIAVTGDLINLALPAEFETSTKWLQELGKPDQVSVIPGNHDAYVSGALAHATQAWSAYMTGDGQEEFIRFPYCRLRKNIAIIGVSSAVATAPFMATGKVGNNQIESLKEILRESAQKNLFRLIMIHHPPQKNAATWHKRLTSSYHFLDIIREFGAELIIHGHTHLNSIGTIQGPECSIPVVGVPSASNSPGGHKPAARYNIFHIDQSESGWNCRMHERGFTKPNGNVVEVGIHQLHG